VAENSDQKMNPSRTCGCSKGKKFIIGEGEMGL
jgi:hypothetical protein